MPDKLNGIRLGCASWTVPADLAGRFAEGETHLHRYSSRFNATEINTSFNRRHRRKTYEDWANATPDGFLFAVKMTKQITHASHLADLSAVGYFLDDVSGLGKKLGVLLVQLPPSLVYDPEIVRIFCADLRDRYNGGVACEPRHASWFTPEVDELLRQYRIARVAADPAASVAAGEPGGWPGLIYYRLHGTPRVYYSAYPKTFLDTMAVSLRAKAETAPVWCIFDNTALGEAPGNALDLLERLEK